jgi:pimeloyl-CoA dehydrogenase large subunit
MELQYNAQEIAFRDEVRDFVRTNLPEHIRQGMLRGGYLIPDHVITWQRILNKKGWAVSHWPVEWGGTGWSPIQQYIFTEELQRTPAPRPLAYSVYMLGPVLIAFGSEEQKRRFLPRIANLDDWWCQGFSEPDAGSDLASLKTSAGRVGDHYIVNGQKTWTSYAQYADWIFCLVRTDAAAPRKQQGISFLLIDMKSEGVKVRPIQTIDGGHEINEVFFENVKVPVENLVGEENKGWDYAKYLLSAERINLARIGVSKERLTRARELAARVSYQGRPLIENARFRAKLSALEIELKALEMTQLRVLSAEGQASGAADPASSILKIKGSELQQATSELLMQVLGPRSLRSYAEEQDAASDWTSTITANYFNWRKVSIFGGSNEIQKSIIARSILGL